MVDDDKKTVLLPRFANMLSYHTVVMEKPPEMTVGLLGASQATPRSARVPRLQATHLASVVCATEDPLRTRMANVAVRPMPPPPPPRPALAPPPQSGTMKTKPVRSALQRKQRMRKIAVFGGAAIVLSVSLLLPLSGGAGASQAASIPPAVTEEVSSAQAERVPELEQAQPSLRPLDPSITEERAATLLLQGRHHEALALYRQLANSPKRSPGIEAMAKVLSQNVESE